MKISILVISLLLLTSCNGSYQSLVSKTEQAPLSHQSDHSLHDLVEYPIISDVVDMKEMDWDITKDNLYKRVILFKKNGEIKYKSIYIKKTNRLKLVKLDEGLLYNEIIQ
ncbi:hypothetical protein PD280_01395 [Virgibacillus salarius]|uniref:hypothetical protein n=1 Tax=Virgibacillus salarius TaxID=447199 RepID=UPI0024916F5C|nr:hypothetical protein [Virgibacillus salarius]WBX80551.1 hypothetical protein PD280_01395 [Virgibacillus salarius]